MPQKKKYDLSDLGGKPVDLSDLGGNRVSEAPSASTPELDVHGQIKKKYGLPQELDLSKGYFAPENAQLFETYNKLRKRGLATKEQMQAGDLSRFSKASQEYASATAQPEEKGLLAGGKREAGRIVSGMLDTSQGGAAGAVPPGQSLVDYKEGIKQHGPVAAIPVAGPMIAQRAEQFKEDPYGAAGAGAIDAVALGLLAKGGESAITGETPRMPQVRNSIAGLLREPATARQSQLGRPGSVKPLMPEFLQGSVVERLIPKGDVGTPTNPGPFAELPMKLNKAAQAKMAGEGPEPFKPFKPSPNVKSMLRSRVTSEPGVPKGPSYAGGAKKVQGGMAPKRVAPSAPESEGLLGNRPSISEARLTELLRKPVVSPAEAAELEKAFGPNWRIKRNEGIIGGQSRQLGLLRARRASRGMEEPE